MKLSLIKNKIILYTILLYPVINFGIKYGGIVIVYLFVIISIAITAIHKKAGFYSYLLLTLISSDYTIKATGKLYNLYTVTIAGHSLFTFYTVILLAIYLLKYFKLPFKQIVKYQFYILNLFIIALVFNISFDSQLGNVITDLSIVVIPLITLIIGLLSKVDAKRILYVLLTVIALKCIHHIILFSFGLGVAVGSTLRVSFDTLRVVPHFLIIFGLVKFLHGQKKTIYFGLILLGAIYTLMYASRGGILVSGVTVMLSIIFYAYKNRKALKSLSYVVLVIAVAFFSLSFLNYVKPQSTKFLKWKITSIKTDVDINDLSSAAVRYLEFQNIVHYLTKDVKTSILGVGPGGYFVDDYIPYVKTLYGQSAYPAENITKREIHKPHGLPLFVLLKLGFIFGAIYYYIYYLIFKDMMLSYFTSDSPLSLFLMSTFPMFFVRVFSSKLQIVLGLFLLMICLKKENSK